MRHHFTAEQWLPYRLPLVFQFFGNPENLPRLMPKWQSARIDEATFRAPPTMPSTYSGEATPQPRSILAGDGSRLTLIFRPFPYSPVRIKWEAAIGHFLWNEQFCDTQLRGPFFFWHHCHKVVAQQNSDTLQQGTLLRDEVEFELPFEPATALVLPLIRAQLAATFRFRHKRTLQLLSQYNLTGYSQ